MGGLRTFTIYGLDRDGAVGFTQTARLAARDEATKLATELLKTYAKVEVWEAAVCVFRSGQARR